MDTEEGNISQVRRTARARKINPKFFGDDAEYGSYKKLVDRITASDYSGTMKDNENLKLQEENKEVSELQEKTDSDALVGGNIDSVNLTPTELASISSQPLSKHVDASGSINIALKTVSVKMPKKCKSNISVQDNLKLASGKVGPSVIVRCRSSTESEDSVVENEGEKRKLDSQGRSGTKKLKSSENQDSNCIEKDKTLDANLKAPTFANCSQLFRKSYVKLPVVSNLDKNQAKIVVTSDGNINLPGKRLKIVSLKPITTINKDNILDAKSKSNSENVGNKLMLGERGPLELKIVKKQIYPLSGSSLPPVLPKENKNETNKSPNETVKITELTSSTKLFSSDGEDDIPLNKFMKQDVGKKKKKSAQKDNKVLKSAIKTKVKNKKLIKNKANNANDQDDLPLKAFIKKSKSLSKGLSTKVKNTVSKKKNVQTSIQSIQENSSQIDEPPSKKKKMDSDPSQNPKTSLKLKFRNMKSVAGVKSQKVKPLLVKKKKMKSFNSGKTEKFRNVLGVTDKKIKKINKAKARKLLSEDQSSVSIKKKESKPTQKLRFKFPKKINKVASNDSPISNETTNIVISVSGIEGDYACVAIDKDHISVPSDVNDENDMKQHSLKKKRKQKSKNSFENSSEKYTVDSGLVLEADVSNSIGISQTSETKLKYVSKEESSNTDVLSFSPEKDSTKTKKSPKKESTKKDSSPKKEKKKMFTGNKESSVKRKFESFKSDSDILLEGSGTVESSYKKENTQLNVDSADGNIEINSYEGETLTNNGDSTLNELKHPCNNEELSMNVKGNLFTVESKPAEDVKTTVAKIKSPTDTMGCSTNQANALSCKDELLYDKVEYGNNLGSAHGEISSVCKVESVSNDTKSILNLREASSNKTQTTPDKPKISNCQEIIKKPLKNKFDEVENQPQHFRTEVNNVVGPIKVERNFVNETNDNISGNKCWEQKSCRETKYSKSRNKETYEKENSRENKKDCIIKSEGKKDKEKNKKKEEKGITDLKSDTSRKFDISSDTDKKMTNDSDHQKHKNQKYENKNEKEKSSGHFRSLNEIKNEEKHIKKEKHDSKELINKTNKDSKSKEKTERTQKESQVLKKSEKYQSLSKVENDNNSKSSSIATLKTNKDTNKISDKKETKVEKDSLVKDGSSPVIKSRKRENFEEALLNIPLPKLSKSKKDKEDKLKRTPSKDRKLEAKDIKQEIHLLKHKEPERSKSFVKSESNSKVFKTEEKSYRKEERRHSSSSSDRSEKRKSDYDSKHSIKMYETPHDNDKSKKEEKERSRHSHKKHKGDHSDSLRSHSLSLERKKHRSGEKYERKHNKDKVIIKKEDSKDLIIKKIVEGKESGDFCNIKTELNSSIDHGNEKIADESSNANLLEASHAKMEPKSEVIIDEEHLVTEKGYLKEENKDNDKSFDLDQDKVSDVSGTYLKKEHIEKEMDVTTEEKKQKEIKPTIYGDILSNELSVENKNKSFEDSNVEKVYQAETLINSNKDISDVAESDIGILDELRNLKQTFEDKTQINKEIETSGNSVTISETEAKLIASESHDIKLDSPLHLQADCERRDDEIMSLEPPTKDDTKTEKLNTVPLDDDDVMGSTIILPPKLEADVQKSDPLQDSVDDFESFSHQNSKLNNSALQVKEQDDANTDTIIRDISDSKGTNTDTIIRDISDSKDDTSNLKFDEPEDSPYLCNIPISLIPLPNETSKESTTEKGKLETSSHDENTHFSKEISSFLSDADEGFISEVSSTTKENLTSDEGTPLASDLSDDECLSAAILPPPPLQPPKELTPEEKEEIERRNIEIVEERMKSFEYLEENLYLSERVKNKRSKEVRRMVCDCTLTKEEIINSEMGCGDDCLNRLLMIECGTRCPLKDRCMNKKFQQKDYSKVEVFNAAEKGCGVRSCEDIKQGAFIMEYIGEVFDTKEFKRRRKEYAKSGSPHFYFMALRPDRLIDATRKGGISRFINHSCSPNAETQKWTVNGDIRIGFYATRNIPAGEEITFDYRLERYGREPQRCFCGTPECRGWLGEPPDKKTKEEKEEDRKRELKDKQKREAKRFLFEDMDLEDEIERLTVRGLRNRQDTLDLSRLMVRCEDSASRLTLLKILESGEEASKRLFLDYHGLKLLWSWMVDISSSPKCIPLKLEILNSLKSLPITNKAQVLDSRVIFIVERWSKMDDTTDRKELQVEGTAKKLSDGSDSDTETGDIKEPSPDETPSPPDDSSQDSNEIVDVPTVVNKIVGESTAIKGGENSNIIDVEEESKYSEAEVVELAKQLLSSWCELKEAFKIPRKKRIEMMKEHEKEVDDEYAKYLDRKSEPVEDRSHSYYDSWRNTSIDHDKQKEYRDRFDRDRKRERRWSKWRDSFDEEDRTLSKEQRRERFAKQVAKEEEEARQRKLQEEMWNLHLERCNLLGHDPYYTPIFDPSGQYYWDPDAGNWQAYIGPSGNLPVPASYGMNRTDVGIGNICPNIPSNKLFGSGSFYPLPHIPISEGEEQPLRMSEDQPSNVLDLASIPLPGESPLAKSEMPKETTQLPGEENVETLNGIETPPMAPPGPVTIKLPPKWKIARDSDRRIYFYHTKTRHTQWEMPNGDLHEKLMIRYGLTSDSESDAESDSDSSSSSDSEDFSSDEDDNDDDEPEVDPVKQIENELNEKMIRRPKGKKVRSEKLVQERVISPILFQDREAARRERKEAKEKARVEARKERYGLLKKNISVENVRPIGNLIALKSDDDKEEKLTLPDEVASPNENDEDDNLEEQLLKFSRKQKSESKSSSKSKSKERAATALADSSDIARKIKDNFRSRMATYIVSVLNPYRKADCKEGRITSNEDFKYLARKLTHFVMVKELKQLPSIDGLECSDSVKHKTKEFVRKYMSKYGVAFKRDPNDTKEY